MLASSGSAGSGGSSDKMSFPIEEYTPPWSNSKHDLKNTFSWAGMLSQNDFVAGPVALYRHAPMSDCWENIIVGMKVEVENRDSEHYSGVFSHAFWVASVLRISGYYALLRYEGFGQDGTKDFWMNLCSERVHPVGWCATKGKPLIPPRTIQTKYTDWKDFLVKRLTGARTLPSNFYCKVMESVGSIFRTGMKLEVVDKMRICQVRVATVMEITGRRLFLQYDNVEHDDNGFWCHEESPLIHPVGWARKVGHQIAAGQDYYDRCSMDNLEPGVDCTPDMFPEYRPPNMNNLVVGMKLEAVDPLNLATVCVATVMKVLRFGYIMIRIDGYETDATGSDWFCYHASSPLIFPPGFCERNDLQLKPPTNHAEKFSWYEYLKETKSQAAPVSLFCPREDVQHNFKVGMKVEAADQMDPRLICVSTISRVVGRLLKVHFDGWEDDYDQWMDCESTDFYPVGWAELVGHKLEGPRLALPAKKEKRKAVGGGRKGGKRNANGLSPATSQGQNSSNQNGTDGGKKSKKNSPAPPEIPAQRSTSATPPPPVLVAEQPSPSKQQQPEKEQQLPEVADHVVEEKHVDKKSPNELLRVIPRLVDSAGQAALQRGGKDSNLNPSAWSCDEVAQFLEINECSSLVEAFAEQKVDGERFLSLEKSEIMKLVNNKIGPCLKVENLLRLLKARMNPAQARFLACTMRK